MLNEECNKKNIFIEQRCSRLVTVSERKDVRGAAMQRRKKKVHRMHASECEIGWDGGERAFSNAENERIMVARSIGFIPAALN